MMEHYRAKTAIGLRLLGKSPKSTVALLLDPMLLPESSREFADFHGGDINSSNKVWDEAEIILEHCNDLGITAIAIGDARYPKRLEELQNGHQYTLRGYCPILYCKGSTTGLNAHVAVAVVGVRYPTKAGLIMAREVGRSLAEAEVTVVSGLALGCDTEGHRGCLEAGGRGVAVLAHGLDRIYPAENIELADELMDAGGCLVSEYQPGTPPSRHAFAYRDRIQSGLADGVLVVETPEKDGTMHTVEFARHQRRDIACVVPRTKTGNPKTAGNIMLIREGAHTLNKAEEAVQFAQIAGQRAQEPDVQRQGQLI